MLVVGSNNVFVGFFCFLELLSYWGFDHLFSVSLLFYLQFTVYIKLLMFLPFTRLKLKRTNQINVEYYLEKKMNRRNLPNKRSNDEEKETFKNENIVTFIFYVFPSHFFFRRSFYLMRIRYFVIFLYPSCKECRE